MPVSGIQDHSRVGAALYHLQWHDTQSVICVLGIDRGLPGITNASRSLRGIVGLSRRLGTLLSSDQTSSCSNLHRRERPDDRRLTRDGPLCLRGRRCSDGNFPNKHIPGFPSGRRRGNRIDLGDRQERKKSTQAVHDARHTVRPCGACLAQTVSWKCRSFDLHSA